MKTEEFKNKKVLVVGLGRSGVAAARFLSNSGADVSVTDMKKEGELGGAMLELEGLPINFILGRHERDSFTKADMIIVSPGVPLDLPGILLARDKKIPVKGEMEFATSLIDRPILAVTGTNGKTTTTALLGHLLNTAGKRACVAGNIGTPVIDVVDNANAADLVVLEVSSFQIETAPSLKPFVSILLNITPDHLDRHESFSAYADCKAKLLLRTKSGGIAIYNASDDVVVRSLKNAGVKLAPFNAFSDAYKSGNVVPSAWLENGELCVLVKGKTPNRYKISEAGLSGIHNCENMLAALLAAEFCGAESDDLKKGLKSFKGLPHRMMFVAEHGGVKYYDDSKGTNIGAMMRAIESFDRPIVLIAGGLSKGVDFSPLASACKGRVKSAILIGEAAGELARVLGKSTKTMRAASMEDAVNFAKGEAKNGDVVLLSPACASFDMFRDYAHRGEMFINAVKKIMGESK